MKKIISALLICMLAAVCLFTGCSKAKGLKVKDSSGNDRVLVTDENGKPVYDEAGNIVIVDTDEKGKAKKDENGEQATNAIALDYLLVSGKNAYCRYFTFTQPSGYDMSAVGTAITLTKGDETIDIIYDTEKSVDDKSADIGEVITSLKAQGFNPEVNDETKTLCGSLDKRIEYIRFLYYTCNSHRKDYQRYYIIAVTAHFRFFLLLSHILSKTNTDSTDSVSDKADTTHTHGRISAGDSLA